MASQNVHMFELFSDNITDMLGEHPNHSILAHLCEEEAGSGKGVWLPGLDPGNSDDAEGIELSAADTLKKFRQLDDASQSWDEFKKTLTPFMDVSKLMTWSSPQRNEWGHTIEEDEEWQEIADPKSSTVNTGMRKIFKKRDIRFLLGATAASVSRKDNDNDALYAMTLPASQTLDDMTFADVTVDTLPSMIRHKFSNVWYAIGMPIYCAISSTLAYNFRKNSRNQIHNNDFVNSYEHFRQGTIPTIEGVTFIEMPDSIMANITAAEVVDSYVAWVPNAIKRVSYKAIKTSMGNSIMNRDATVIYVREKEDYKRIDDLGVVVGDIIAAA